MFNKKAGRYPLTTFYLFFFGLDRPVSQAHNTHGAIMNPWTAAMGGKMFLYNLVWNDTFEDGRLKFEPHRRICGSIFQRVKPCWTDIRSIHFRCSPCR